MKMEKWNPQGLPNDLRGMIHDETAPDSLMDLGKDLDEVTTFIYKALKGD